MRFRPILMTTMAVLLSGLRLMLEHGAGSEPASSSAARSPSGSRSPVRPSTISQRYQRALGPILAPPVATHIYSAADNTHALPSRRREIMKTVADQFAETLAAVGINRIYGIIGDSMNGMTDMLRRQGKIRVGPRPPRRGVPLPARPCPQEPDRRLRQESAKGGNCEYYEPQLLR
jgi:hypothetical protein